MTALKGLPPIRMIKIDTKKVKITQFKEKKISSSYCTEV